VDVTYIPVRNGTSNRYQIDVDSIKIWSNRRRTSIWCTISHWDKCFDHRWNHRFSSI